MHQENLHASFVSKLYRRSLLLRLSWSSGLCEWPTKLQGIPRKFLGETLTLRPLRMATQIAKHAWQVFGETLTLRPLSMATTGCTPKFATLCLVRASHRALVAFWALRFWEWLHTSQVVAKANKRMKRQVYTDYKFTLYILICLCRGGEDVLWFKTILMTKFSWKECSAYCLSGDMGKYRFNLCCLGTRKIQPTRFLSQ